MTDRRTAELTARPRRGYQLKKLTSWLSSGVLREHQFRRQFAAQAISSLGDGMAPIALALGILSVDNSASGLGLVLAARTVATVIFVLIGGFSIVDVPSREEALAWAAKFAVACRCAQEIREIMHDPEQDAMLRQAARRR